MEYRKLYETGWTALEKAGIADAKLDAVLLLESVCGTDRNALLVHGERPVAEECRDRYLSLIEERGRRIPLQHLLGEQEFMGLPFSVNDHVLIPRQDTEILVEEVQKKLQGGMRILDLCTGSGCILLSLLYYSRDCFGVGADISEEALTVARTNARRLFPEYYDSYSQEMDTEGTGELKTGGRIAFLQSDLFDRVTGKYDIIVSNPPYISSAAIGDLMPEVREHEPLLALDGGGDGLFFYRKIVERSADYLVYGGRLYFEIGYDQAEAVTGLMEQAGFMPVTSVKDYAGLDRVVYGTYTGMERE